MTTFHTTRLEGWAAVWYRVDRAVHLYRLTRPDGTEHDTEGISLSHAVDLMPRALWTLLRVEGGNS
ncbi:hypothetical protein [Nocardia wallacei]|uniref:hypothetical protein n=1 Tax=Nocardia wallacei TaxID=480035 RepID=UPI002457C4FA|nr:hypothetical protein [Nocardia wallacei]